MKRKRQVGRQFRNRLCTYPLLCVLCLFVAGCQSPIEHTDGEPSAASLKNIADQEPADQIITRGLYWLQEDRIDVLTEVIKELQACVLHTNQQIWYELLASYRDLTTGDEEDAKGRLDQVSLAASMLSTDQHRMYYELLASYFQRKGDPSNRILSLVKGAEHVTTAQEREMAAVNIWTLILRLSSSEEKSLSMLISEEPSLVGWIALKRLFVEKAESSSERAEQFFCWKREYPHHMANGLIKEERVPSGWMQRSLPGQTRPFRRLGLLLPLSGEYAGWGASIRAGIEFAASSEGRVFYQQLLRQQQRGIIEARELPPWPSVEIRAYDTEEDKDIAEVASKAKQEGAEILLGPLFRKQVTMLQKTPSALPTVYLNSTRRAEGSRSACCYDLSERTEARETAYYLWKRGIRYPLVYVSGDVQDRKMATAFVEAWQYLSSEPPVVRSFLTSQEIKACIDRAPIRKESNYRLLPQFFSPVQTERGDRAREKRNIANPVSEKTQTATEVDGVFLIASPDDLVLLKAFIEKQRPSTEGPLLLVAKEIPLQERLSKQRLLLDLDHVEFCTIPLLAGPKHDRWLAKILQRIPKKDEFSIRLFAMGMDAYCMARYWQRWQLHPEEPLYGATGSLRWMENGWIRRSELVRIRLMNGQESVTK